MLTPTLPIGVESARPLYNADTSRMPEPERRRRSSNWALALGLSLKFTKGGFMPRDGRPRAEQIAEEAFDDAASIGGDTGGGDTGGDAGREAAHA